MSQPPSKKRCVTSEASELPAVPEASVAAEPDAAAEQPALPAATDYQEEAQELEDMSRFEDDENACMIDSDDDEESENIRLVKNFFLPYRDHDYDPPKVILGTVEKNFDKFDTNEVTVQTEEEVEPKVDDEGEVQMYVREAIAKERMDDPLEVADDESADECSQLEARLRYAWRKIDSLRKTLEAIEKRTRHGEMAAALEVSLHARETLRRELAAANAVIANLREVAKVQTAKVQAGMSEAAKVQTLTAERDTARQIAEDLRRELASAKDVIAEARRETKTDQGFRDELNAAHQANEILCRKLEEANTLCREVEAAAGRQIVNSREALSRQEEIAENLRTKLKRATEHVGVVDTEARRQADRIIEEATAEATAIVAAATVEAEQLHDVALIEIEEERKVLQREGNKTAAQNRRGKNELKRLQEDNPRLQDLRPKRARK